MMDETIFKEISATGNKANRHTAFDSENNDAAQRSFFLIGFGKRFRYRRQIYHLSHYYPIPDTPSHPCHRRRFGLSEICRLQQ